MTVENIENPTVCLQEACHVSSITKEWIARLYNKLNCASLVKVIIGALEDPELKEEGIIIAGVSIDGNKKIGIISASSIEIQPDGQKQLNILCTDGGEIIKHSVGPESRIVWDVVIEK